MSSPSRDTGKQSMPDISGMITLKVDNIAKFVE